MNKEEKITINSATKTSPTTIGTINLSKNKRIRTALKTLLFLWAGACASLFLPILHFILVPGLFILGPFLAWRKYAQVSYTLPLTLACLHCKNKIPLNRRAIRWPMEITCSQCLQRLTLKPS